MVPPPPSRRLEPCYASISTEGPSDRDRENDTHLFDFMSKHVPVMAKQDLERRERVLQQLTAIFREWVQQTCIAKGVPEDVAMSGGGLIFTSGSYRLGIHEPGSDIDAHCCAPMYCTREDFFTTLKKKLSEHPSVTNFNSIETAAVPIMSFDFDEVNIDLGLATLPVPTIDQAKFDIDDDLVLKGVDIATEKCLNGPRVTNMIHKLVPNFDSFLPVVRLVRMWAKRRALYGNKMGYLGGVNYNILVAFVCQLYPRASPSKLLASFFKVMRSWSWPNPILLAKPFDAGLNLEVWQASQNPWHVMPIITPAYPSMNSSVAVSAHSLAVITAEFARADAICKDILEKGGKSWEELLQPSEFFAMHSHYLAVDIMAGSEEEFRAWRGYTESRLRKLLDNFSYLRLPMQKLHLFPKAFDECCSGGVGGELPAYCVCFFIGFELDKARMKASNSTKLDVSAAFAKFEEAATKTPWHKEGMALALTPYTPKKLPAWCFVELGGPEAAQELRQKLKEQIDSNRKARLAAIQAAAPQIPKPPAKDITGSATGGGGVTPSGTVVTSSGEEIAHVPKEGFAEGLEDEYTGDMDNVTEDTNQLEEKKPLLDEKNIIKHKKRVADHVETVTLEPIIHSWQQEEFAKAAKKQRTIRVVFLDGT